MLTIFIAEYHRFGGSQRAMMYTACGLMAAGVEVNVILPADGEAAARYRAAGLNVHVIAAPPPLLQFGGVLLRINRRAQLWTLVRHGFPYSYKVHRFMRTTGSRVLHCNTSRAVVLAGLVPRICGSQVLWHVRAQRAAAGALVARYCQLVASTIILICNATLSELSSRAVQKAVVVNDGIDVDDCRRRAVRRNAGLQTICSHYNPAGNGAVVMVASLTPFKGQHILADAAAILKTRMGDAAPCYFLIGGASDLVPQELAYERYLRTSVQAAGIDHFHFVGWSDDPMPLIADATVVVLPSVEHDDLWIDGATCAIRGGEAFPAATLEAMALGKPVVVSDNAGMPEQVVHGETGFVVPQRDPGALADAIETLLVDRDESVNLGRAGAKRVSALFDRNVTVPSLQSIYNFK